MASNTYRRRQEIPASLESHSAVTRLDEKTFTADLTKSFCVGTVPQGGYTASVFLKVAQACLAARGQPDTITANWQFLNRSREGPAVLVVEETKVGRTMSVLHITLHQDGLLPQAPWVSPSSPKVVVGYVTNGNMVAQSGMALPTGWTLPHDTTPKADLQKLAANEDPHWYLQETQFFDRVVMMKHVEMYISRRGLEIPGIIDHWMRFKTGDPILQTQLPFLVDLGPPSLMESYRASGPDEPPAKVSQQQQVGSGSFLPHDRFNWYPTVSYTWEAKKKLPETGITWIRMRTSTKLVHAGRNDCEVLVFDAAGDLIGVANIVALVLDATRNTSGRSQEWSNYMGKPKGKI